MKTKRRPLTPDDARKWSDWVQLNFIDALVQASSWTCEQISFHGGTSLHLSWKSPRFSEDLDFLIEQSKALDMSAIMNKVQARLQQQSLLFDPLLQVQIKDKSKDESNLLNFQVVVSHPSIIGNAMIKAEFWKVDESYLKEYQNEFVLPIKQNDVISRVSQPIPAATLQAAYADKLTAFATRPFLKWRDVFDLWWIGKQIKVNPAEMALTFKRHVSAYNTVNDLPLRDALLSFTKMDRQSVIDKANPDLKNWLPPALWDALNPQGVEQMVDYVQASLKSIASQIGEHEMNVQAKPVIHKPKKNMLSM